MAMSEKSRDDAKLGFNEHVDVRNVFVNMVIKRFASLNRTGTTVYFNDVLTGRQIDTNLSIKIEHEGQAQAAEKLESAINSYLETKNPEDLQGIKGAIEDLQKLGTFDIKLDVLNNGIREEVSSSQSVEDFLAGKADFAEYRDGDKIEVEINGQMENLEVKGFSQELGDGVTFTQNFMVGDDNRAYDVHGNSIDIDGFMSAKQDLVDIQNNPFATELDKENAQIKMDILDKYINQFEINNVTQTLDHSISEMILGFDPTNMTAEESQAGIDNFINSIKDLADLTSGQSKDPSDVSYMNMDEVKQTSEDLQDLKQDLKEKNMGASEEEQQANKDKYDEMVDEIDRRIFSTYEESSYVNGEKV